MNHNLLVAPLGGTVQEPADESEPDSADKTGAEEGDLSTEDHRHTHDDQKPGDRLSRVGSPAGGSAQIIGSRPENGT